MILCNYEIINKLFYIKKTLFTILLHFVTILFFYKMCATEKKTYLNKLDSLMVLLSIPLNQLPWLSRKSFLSGHASYSFYNAIFLVLYLQIRFSKSPNGNGENKKWIKAIFEVDNFFFEREMVFCFKKLVWPSVRIFFFTDWDYFLEIWGWRLRICKDIEITRIIYSNSERLEQFLKQITFLTCYSRFLQI